MQKKIKTIVFSLLLINLAVLVFFPVSLSSPLEKSLLFKLFLLVVVSWVWYSAYKQDYYEQLIIVTLYLTIFNLDKLYLGISVPIPIILIFAALSAIFLFICSIRLKMAHDGPYITFYALLSGLITAESFLIASLWSPNNATLAAIVVVCFYYTWHITMCHLDKKLSTITALSYSVYSLMAILLIIYTSSWYNT